MRFAVLLHQGIRLDVILDTGCTWHRSGSESVLPCLLGIGNRKALWSSTRRIEGRTESPRCGTREMGCIYLGVEVAGVVDGRVDMSCVG